MHRHPDPLRSEKDFTFVPLYCAACLNARAKKARMAKSMKA
jgi:hypothetical protein